MMMASMVSMLLMNQTPCWPSSSGMESGRGNLVHQKHRHHAGHHHQGWRVAEGIWFIKNIDTMLAIIIRDGEWPRESGSSKTSTPCWPSSSGMESGRGNLVHQQHRHHAGHH